MIETPQPGCTGEPLGVAGPGAASLEAPRQDRPPSEVRKRLLIDSGLATTNPPHSDPPPQGGRGGFCGHQPATHQEPPRIGPDARPDTLLAEHRLRW